MLLETLEKRFKFWKRNYFLLLTLYMSTTFILTIILHKFGTEKTIKTGIIIYILLNIFKYWIIKKTNKVEKNKPKKLNIGIQIIAWILRIIMITIIYNIWTAY